MRADYEIFHHDQFLNYMSHPVFQEPLFQSDHIQRLLQQLSVGISSILSSESIVPLRFTYIPETLVLFLLYILVRV